METRNCFVIDHAYLFVPNVSPYYQNTRARSAILFHFNAVRDVTSHKIYVANLLFSVIVEFLQLYQSFVSVFRETSYCFS